MTDGGIDVGTVPRWLLRGPLPCLWNMSSKSSRLSSVLCCWGKVVSLTCIYYPRGYGPRDTRITYIAQFSYRFGLEHLARQQTAGLKKMGAPVLGVAEPADDNPSHRAIR